MSERGRPEDLGSGIRWARRIAAELVRDPGEAEDVAQDATVAAWRRGPEAGAGLEHWMRTVVERLAWRAGRAAERRQRREHAVARPEEQPSAHELVERAEACRRVVQAVLALPEPYRGALLMRYMQELSPSAIARELGLPLATVSTRLRRGLALLRERLGAGDTDLRATLAALLARPRVPLTPGTLLLMKASSKLALALALVGAFSLAVLLLLRGEAKVPSLSQGPGRLPAAGDPLDGREAIRPPAKPAASAAGQRALSPATEQATPELEHEREAITGVVLDADENPIADALVEAWHSFSDGYEIFLDEQREPARLVASTRSAAGGGFRLPLERGKLYDLRAAASGFSKEAREDRYAGDRVEIVLQRGTSLYGYVLRAGDESAVAEALLTLTCGADESFELETRTDASGAYRFDDLPPGPVGLMIDPLVERSPRYQSLELAPGEPLRRDFLVEPGVVLRGRVVDATTRAPIAGAQLSPIAFLRRTVTSDSDGRFTLGGIDAIQMLTLSVRAPGYGIRSWTSREEAPLDATIELVPGVAVSGRLHGPDGSACAGASVLLTAFGRVAGDARCDTRSTRTAEDGSFRLEGLNPDSSYNLLARLEGHPPLWLDVRTPLTSGEEADLGELFLERPASVYGRVVDAEGRTPEGLRLEITWMGDDQPTARMASLCSRQLVGTDVAGRFAFLDLQAGTWMLRVLVPDEPAQEQSLTLRAGEEREGYEIVLSMGLAVEGLVLDAAGRAVEGASVAVHPPGKPYGGVYVRSDRDGRFKSGGLAAGVYEVHVRLTDGDGLPDPRYESWGASDVLAGSVLEVRLEELSSQLAGMVVDALGKPVAQARVWRSYEGVPPTRFVDTDDEGRFRITVPEGSTSELVAARTTTLGESGLPGFTRAELKSGRAVVRDASTHAHAAGLAAGSEGLVLRLP